MSAPDRRGFTLLEFLVVLALLGTLIGLMLPAVQRVRDAAARAQCENNLHWVCIACHDYADAHQGVLPSNPDLIRDRFGTTQDFLQPYME